MIIWGSRGLTSTKEEGQFHCPKCSAARGYRLRQVRTFFTLYFIPVIPLNVAGRYVECSSCGGTFSEEIKDYDPTKERQAMEEQMLRVMILAALADGKVDDNELRAIKKQYFDLAGLPVTDGVLSNEIKLATQSGTTLNRFLAPLANQFNPHGKGMIVKLAFETMIANGDLTPQQETELAGLAKTLEISEDQYRALIDHIAEQSEG